MRDYSTDGNKWDMLDFAARFPGWHSFASDRLTVEHVCALSNLRQIIVVGRQFKITNEGRRVLAAHITANPVATSPYLNRPLRTLSEVEVVS